MLRKVEFTSNIFNISGIWFLLNFVITIRKKIMYCLNTLIFPVDFIHKYFLPDKTNNAYVPEAYLAFMNVEVFPSPTSIFWLKNRLIFCFQYSHKHYFNENILAW